ATVPPELWMREGIVFRRPARARGPNQLAGLFVERVKTVGRRTVRAPIRRDAPRDDQIAVNRRRRGAAVGKRESPELLHQRMLPQGFPVRREGREDSLRALHIDGAGLRVDSGAGSRVAKINCIAEVIVIKLLPYFLAGRGVETSHPFLQIGP